MLSLPSTSNLWRFPRIPSDKYQGWLSIEINLYQNKLNLAVFEENEKMPMKRKANFSTLTVNKKKISGSQSNLLNLPDENLSDIDTTSPQYCVKEVSLLVLVAHENFLGINPYSVVKKALKTSRASANIRRKLEKLISKEIGVFGGLLKDQSVRNRAKQALKRLFLKFMATLKTSKDAKTLSFANKLLLLIQERNLLLD